MPAEAAAFGGGGPTAAVRNAVRLRAIRVGPYPVRSTTPRGSSHGRSPVCRGLRIYPGNPVPAVNKLNLDIADGEFMVLVGPSGSGKSTALRMLAGLEDVDEGEIRSAATTSRSKPPKDRDIAMVFQNYALYPHMSVAENMGFALKLRASPRTSARQGPGRRPSCSTWSRTSTASRRHCPVASASASRWVARSCASPACS